MTSGALAGSLSYHRQAVNVRSDLDRLAVAFADLVNRQHRQGIDLSGRSGVDLFSTESLTPKPAAGNKGVTEVLVDVSQAGTLPDLSYTARYDASSRLWTVKSSNNAVTATGRDEVVIDGIRLAFSGSPADGDVFTVSPLENAAQGIRLLTQDPSRLAAALPRYTEVGGSNEGNGDLTQTLPKTHIVIASLEKIVPTLEDVSQILRVLARSATGQEMSVYTTFSTGPRRAADLDGPENYHVVILDNGRSSMLGTAFQDMLRCIRCGACMNHCPVYHAVGGHAYGWVYPGPMGAVLTPTLLGVDKAGHLPNASTFCGRCESVCPVRIPLPKMMRHWREAEFERHLSPATMRSGIKFWAFFAKRPALYRFATSLMMNVMGWLGRDKGCFSSVPLASGWTDYRDFPAPQGGTFQSRYQAHRKSTQNNGRAA
jgi:ferredoxin